MSEQKKAPAKTSQPGTFQKILNWFKRLPGRIAKPFKNMWYELKKVTWPSKRKLITYSVIVLVFMLFMGLVIGLLDTGASALVRKLMEINS
jgi:preprotein translocase subunit SecE